MRDADAEGPVVKLDKLVGVRVSVAIDAMSEHQLWSDLTLSADSGGVFVATYHHLPLGTTVDVVLTLPDAEPPIAMKGVVRWTRSHRDDADDGAGVGIKFVDVAADARERLDRFTTTVREPMLFDLDDAPMRRRRASSRPPRSIA